MSTTDELSESERQHRYNHWQDNDSVSRCKQGCFVSKPAPENGQVRYYCGSCDRWYLEYVGRE